MLVAPRETSKRRHTLSKFLFFCLSAAVCGESRPLQARELVGDLAPVLEILRLPASDVTGMTTVLSQETYNWKYGIDGTLQPTTFALKHLGGIRAVRSKLRISCSDKNMQDLKFAQCDIEGTCQEITTKLRADTFTFTMDDNSWEMTFYQNPCAVQETPTYIPSWALEQRRKSQGGSMRSFPEVVALISHGNYISIFDLQSNKYWHRLHIKSSQRQDAGNLQKAMIDAAGRLFLEFTNVNFLLDIAKGLLFELDTQGAFARSMLDEDNFVQLRESPFPYEPPALPKLNLTKDGDSCSWRLIDEKNVETPPISYPCLATVGLAASTSNRLVTIKDGDQYRVVFMP